MSLDDLLFSGLDMNGHTVYGLLVKKRIRNSGSFAWAIANRNFSLADCVPVEENSIQIMVGRDSIGSPIFHPFNQVSIVLSTEYCADSKKPPNF